MAIIASEIEKKRDRKKRSGWSYADQKLFWSGFPFTYVQSGFVSSDCDIHTILLHEDDKLSDADFLNFAHKTCLCLFRLLNWNFMEVWTLEVAVTGLKG